MKKIILIALFLLVTTIASAQFIGIRVGIPSESAVIGATILSEKQIYFVDGNVLQFIDGNNFTFIN